MESMVPGDVEHGCKHGGEEGAIYWTVPLAMLADNRHGTSDSRCICVVEFWCDVGDVEMALAKPFSLGIELPTRAMLTG